MSSSFDAALQRHIVSLSPGGSLHGTLYAETRAALPLFLALARHGFLSTDSQDGSVSRARSIPAEPYLFSKAVPPSPRGATEEDPAEVRRVWRARYAQRGGKFKSGIRDLQRAYACGFMEREAAELLVFYMNRYTDKVAFIAQDGEGTVKFTCTWNADSTTVENNPPALRHLREALPSAWARTTSNREQMAHMAKWCGFKLPRNVVEVVAFDPVHARKAVGRRGLLSQLVTGAQWVSRHRR